MDGEKWQNLGYLFWAYTFFWGLLAVYLVILANRMRRLRHEVKELRRQGAEDRNS